MSVVNTFSRQTTDSQLNNGAAEKTKSGTVTRQSSFHPTHHEPDITEYFVGPRDIEKHSKLPPFLQMHGSVLPKMIVPLTFVGCWATLISCISEFVYPLIVSTVLLTVLGFVVGLGISFRTSSAYERYNDGRRYWAHQIQASRDLARLIWIHAEERHEEDAELGKSDLLAKVTALNLIVAFAVALKHKLRFEPYANYPDLEHLVCHLETFANDAYDPDEDNTEHKVSTMKAVGTYLGVPFAQSNPRKQIKRAKRNLGNLPLEILGYLSAYVDTIIANGTFKNGPTQSIVMNNLAAFSEVLAGSERVLNTPLPIAYSIAINQITWVYVLMLPFQLWDALHWVAIPGTIVAAYIILGIAAIGREIENPFGQDVNDLPLDVFCKQLSAEIDVIASKAPPKPSDFISTAQNRILYPLSLHEYDTWNAKSVDEIRAALKAKANTASVANEPTLPPKSAGHEEV